MDTAYVLMCGVAVSLYIRKFVKYWRLQLKSMTSTLQTLQKYETKNAR